MRAVYEQSSGIQLSDSETAPPMACLKPNHQPNVTNDYCMESCFCKRIYITRCIISITVHRVMTDSIFGEDINGEGATYPNIVYNIPVDESDDVLSPSRVRTHFPETWLWFHRMIGYSISILTRNRTYKNML